MGKAAKMEVSIKHSGKTYSVPVTEETSSQSFKDAVSQLTRVPTERMKVMVKGKLIKDDVDFVALANQKQTLMVIGAAEALPEPPAQKIVFLEDMGDVEVGLGEEPAGLVNLGNTCYLNSTLQALRVMPEVHQALQEFTPSTTSRESRLASSLKRLFGSISGSSTATAPIDVIQSIRSIAPQFAETDSHGHYSQQDADEAWTCLVSALRASLPRTNDETLVDKLMSIEFTKTLKCGETDAEPETTSTEHALKLECNISGTTNFLMSGIQDSLNQQVMKNSAILGRDATFQMQARVSRLPEYLVVHMVRFYWRRDIQKKAKIMRKVKFPLHLDLTDIATDDLRTRIQPINAAVKQISKERDSRANVLKRKPGQGIDEEKEKRAEESKSIDDIVSAGGAGGPKRYESGYYELSAMVTHKGASADSGHYIGWSRVNDDSFAPSEEQRWAKFDDDKVTFVDANKVLSMDGGGEDSAAYILVYRAVNI